MNEIQDAIDALLAAKPAVSKNDFAAQNALTEALRQSEAALAQHKLYLDARRLK